MSRAIVSRELTSFLRTRRALLLQVGLAVLFATLVLLRWPTDARIDRFGERSREVYRTFGFGLLAFVILITPVFPATSLVRERIQGTLELLLASPLRSWTIYFGKMLGILGLVLVLLTMSLPAAAACYAMGGISLSGDLLALYALLLLVATEYAALGMLVSSYAKSIDSAVRITYGLVFALALLTLGPHQFLQGGTGLLSAAAEYLRCVSPIAACMELLGQQDIGGQGLVSAAGIAKRHAVFAVFATLVMAIWTISRLNHRLLDRAKAAGTITNELGLLSRIFRRLMFLVDPQRRKPGIPWFVNPIMVKEFRTRRFGRSHWLMRMVSLCVILSLTLACFTATGSTDWSVETIGGILVVLQMGLVILITPSLSAGLISIERESGGWDLLRMTPVSSLRILTGKLASVVWPLSLILLATVPGYFVMIYVKPGTQQSVVRVLICLALTLVFGMLLSTCVGSFFRKTATATIAAYSLLLTFIAVPMLIWVGRDAPFSHSTVEAALTLSPAAAALSAIRVQGFEDYELIPLNWWIIGGSSAVFFLVLLVQTWRLTKPD